MTGVQTCALPICPRTLCNITGLPEPVRALIAASLRGQSFLPAQALQLCSALDYGGLAVLADAWTRFGLDRFLAGLGTARQQGLLKAMIFGRLLFPSAKLALSEQAEGTVLAQACGLPAACPRPSPLMKTTFTKRWIC